MRFTRRLQALAGRELSQECFAPKAASPRIGGELRLPFAAELHWGWGGGVFWDGTAGNGGKIRLLAPPAALQGAPPPGLRTCRWLLSCCVGQAGPLGILTNRGRGRRPEVGNGGVFQAWFGEGEAIAY